MVGGTTGVHFFKQEGPDLRRVRSSGVQQGENRHLSTFGPYLALQLLDKPNRDISIATASVEEDFVNLNFGMEFHLEGEAVVWKLWEST